MTKGMFHLSVEIRTLTQELYNFNLKRVQTEDEISLYRDEQKDHEFAKSLTLSVFQEAVESIKESNNDQT